MAFERHFIHSKVSWRCRLPKRERDPREVHWIVSWAYATRRAQSIEAAKVILLDAVDNHRKAAIIHYNLACYECQLGDLEAAKKYLDVAFRLDKKYRIRALDDEDLMALWLMLEEE